MQLHQLDVLRQLADLEASLLVLSFAEPERLRHWIPHFRRRFLEPTYARSGSTVSGDPFERTRFLADPARTVYHAYGLGRNSVWRVYGPRIIWRYVRWGIQGKPIHIQDDPLQRGGDFVVGRDDRLTLAHTGRNQSDRPPVSVILAVLRQA